VSERRIATTLVISALLVWPLLPHVPYDALNTAILACYYLIAALSLVLLIGLVGQISLAQAAFVGMGAFISALAVRKLGIEFPWVLAVGTLAGALTASAIGVVALRVRGLYLAVATLIFAYICDQYLFSQPWLVQAESGTSIPPEAVGRAGTLPYLNLADAHIFYYIALAVAVFGLYALANLRESRVGRAFAAIRGSEVAAASLGIDVVRFKLVGFAVAGGLAGLSGALTLLGQRTVAPDQFNFTASLYFLAIAVVGGLRSLGGAIASALLFALLVGEVFFRFPPLADFLDLISAGLLIVVLLFFRGGLGALPEKVRDARARVGHRVGVIAARLAFLARPAAAVATEVRRWTAARAARRVQAAKSTPRREGGPVDVVSVVDRVVPSSSSRRPAAAETARDGVPEDSLSTLERLKSDDGIDEIAGETRVGGRRWPELVDAAQITVRFGGLTAVNGASMKVCAGEIVGLIGPNGAGKTTLFNSVLGLNRPTAGKVSLYGHDVTGWPVHKRAALGVGRTFQVLQLFRDISVYDNLLVATHLQNRTGLFGAIFVTPAARMREAEARRRVEAVLRLMELEQYAHRPVSGLPFGVLRLIEVARTLVTGARLVCFDEPASGLDSAETEKLIEWFRFLRRMGITLLVIEHDVSMVVRLCDYIYVLDQGKLIAEGTPAEIQRDDRVIASYLGTSAEATA